MNYGIGNVKGKGGVAIPTITIASSQMIDQTHIQLTDEQYDIIANNSFIGVALPTGAVWGFNRVQDNYGNYHLAMCVGSSTEISYTTGDIDSTTKIITISMGDFSTGGGKQLYQHFVVFGGSEVTNIRFNYIDDSPTPLDRNSIVNWFTNKGFSSSKPYPCTAFAGNVFYNGLYFNGTYWQLVNSAGVSTAVTNTTWDFYNDISL